MSATPSDALPYAAVRTSTVSPRRPARRMARGIVAAATLIALGSPAAFAGGGTTPATGASGAGYALTVTCATRSATVRASLATATNFAGFTLTASNGFSARAPYIVNGVPAVSGPQNWVFSTKLFAAASAYSLSEISNSSAGTPVAGPVSTTDCPTYSGVGAQFVPVSPTRILDTRPGSAIGYSGPKPGIAGIVDVQVAGRAGVPADAVAVALNITMTEASRPGFVQALPTGVGTAGGSSNINAETVGQTIANSAIVPIGIAGRVTLFTSGGAHLLADVSGYFVNATDVVAPGRFVAVTPRRVLDTRTASALNYSGGTPGAGATVRINPGSAAGLPPGQVAAVAVNVTATESAAAGFVQVAPAGSLVPGANSNLNLTRAGQTIPNMVIVPVSASGEIDLFTQTGTNLVVDVLGWFTNGSAPSSASGLYFPVIPERVLDTRPDSAVNFDAERRPIAGETSKPAAAGNVDVQFDGLPTPDVGAVVLNLTATEATAAGYVQGAAKGGLTPGASSNVNVERTGQTIANAAILPVNPDRAISLFTQNGTNLIADIGGFFRK